MKRDFNVPVMNFDGTPVERTIYKIEKNGLHKVDEKGQFVFERVEHVLLKGVLFELLGGRYAADNNPHNPIGGTQLLARYAVAAKIAKAGDGPTEIDDADMSALMEVAEKGASPLVYGLLKEILSKDPEPAATA